MAYTLTREALLLDLHAAFQSAKRKKAGKPYVRVFEKNLDANINSLADDLINRTYQPEPSSCFVVQRPKKREVFAAQFRDRVVHHLYFNYTHKLFERTFIADTYSCIEGRGTHYGIDRLKKHIRQESMNWQRDCYVMKLDIRGYFMHIDRQRLLEIATCTLKKMAGRVDGMDVDFLLWLTEQIVMLDPKTSCKIIGTTKEWEGLDKNKSLFHTPDGCGLPIGNLTSQLFSNVYLNELDQYCKRTLGCKHYGRYVDDAYIVSRDKEWLLSLVPQIRDFLKDRLHLELHMGKTQVLYVRRGVEFLGAYILPYRTYISNESLMRMMEQMECTWNVSKESIYHSVNSWLGVLGHYDSFNIRCELFMKTRFLRYGTFDRDMTTFTLSKPTTDIAM
jgi:retron-type reverse transcriptase